MRKCFFIGLELAVIALVTGSMLTGQPLWMKPAPAAAPAAATTATLAQGH